MRRLLLFTIFLLGGCQNSETLMQRGTLAYLRGDSEQAARHFQEASNSPQTRPAAFYNLGRLSLEARDGSTAAGFLEQAEGPLIRVYRARAFRLLGETEKARDALTGLSPELPEVRLESALFHSAQGDQEEAIRLLGSLRSEPEFYERAALEAARLKASSGDRQGAISDLEILVVKRPQRLNTFGLLGDYLLKLKDYEAAESRFRKVLRYAPAYYPATLGLGEALEGQGRRTEAAERYQELLQRLGPTHDAGKEALRRLDGLKVPR